MKTFRMAAILGVILGLVAPVRMARAQSASGSGASASLQSSSPAPAHVQPGQTSSAYHRPSGAIKLHNYLFDTFGPYSIATAALAGGINQAKNNPPEWGQGMAGYGQRGGSNYGTEIITHTARPAL